MLRKALFRLTDKNLIRAIQFLILFLAFLSFMALSRVFPFFPSPFDVARAAVEFFGRGENYDHLLTTLYETVVGFAIGVFLGISIGVLLGMSRYLAEVFEPIIVSVYSIPKIVFLPVLLMIFGVGLSSKIANATLHAIFPIVLNALVGIREVSQTFVKVARSMSATRRQIFMKIYFPSSVLPVFAGMRIGLGFAFLGSLLAELFEAKAGLGYLVAQFYKTAQIARMLAVILLVFILTMSINAGVKRIESRLSRWRGTWKV